jgi:hypothetical protein
VDEVFEQVVAENRELRKQVKTLRERPLLFLEDHPQMIAAAPGKGTVEELVEIERVVLRPE